MILPSEDIAENPPENRKHEYCHDDGGMAEGIVKPGHAVLEEGRECQHRDIRNHQHQESIVPERGSDVTVQKGVDNALRAATWTT